MLKFIFLIFGFSTITTYGQNIVEDYSEPKSDSLRIGIKDTDFLKLISSGYTLALPEKGKHISGVIVFLEDSGFDNKNKSAKQIYSQAFENGYAVLSVSTEIPLDFFFSDKSILNAHKIIERAFKTQSLPNKNVFLVGVGLSGHRALKYVEFANKTALKFQLNIIGLVICDSPLDWVRQYNEGSRDIRIDFDKGAVWEGTFSNYMLDKNLNGTPKTNLESYLNFSTYSYTDEQDRHIEYFKDYAVRAYMEMAVQYWLEKKRKTLFDNNGPDMVGLISQLKIAENIKSELVVIYPSDSKTEKKNPDATWTSVDKRELFQWIVKQTY